MARAQSAGGKWSERFSGPLDSLMERFNSSLSFDRRLARYEIAASAAHARMLAARGIIGTADGKAILEGLREVKGEIERGEFEWHLADEDVHTAVERRLTELKGDAGARLHTARSRNDQIATDIRMWLRDMADTVCVRLVDARLALLGQARRHSATLMPGMTHLQFAQPTTFGHHLHAHERMLARDCWRLEDCRERLNMLPLGSAAMAGTGFPIDRKMVARELGFAGLCENTADAVSDRDFAVEFASASALVMAHLSRLCEELVIWSSQPFGFVRIADAYSTGSSIMPHKRNPDAAELVRGKTGRVYGHVVSLLTMIKGQPLAYNKDNQEDKEPLFGCADTVCDCLAVVAGMVGTMRADKGTMRSAAAEGHSTATELADLLARKGVPFRQAHSRVSALVREAENRNTAIASLPDEVLSELSGIGASAARSVLDAGAAVSARSHYGSPAPAQLIERLAEARKQARALRRKLARRLADRRP